MEKRQEWLEDVNRSAANLLASPQYGERFNQFLREEQRGRWVLDNISGYYWCLHALVEVTKPTLIVELGRCHGTSALFMLGALSSTGRLVTVDISERGHELRHCFQDPRLTVLVGNDLDLGIYHGLHLGLIDFLFIDTEHNYEQAMKEWKLYLPLLSPDAIVVFDDTLMNDMPRFWNELGCAKLETGSVYHYTGFGLVAPSACIAARTDAPKPGDRVEMLRQ